jgi:hypothetical protein
MVIKLKKQISSIGSFWKIDKIKFYFVLPESHNPTSWKKIYEYKLVMIVLCYIDCSIRTIYRCIIRQDEL